MTRYRRKPVEVEVIEYGDGSYAVKEPAGVVWTQYPSQVHFEREYEPVPSGVCSFGHASQAECEASDARAASLKLADELATLMGARDIGAFGKVTLTKAERETLSAYLESRKGRS